MMPVGEKTLKIQPVAEDLLPYRRLVELQKQMIELAHQHEQAKRACQGLREQMTLEMAIRRRARQGLGQRLRQFATGIFTRRLGLSVITDQFNPCRSTPDSAC